MINTYIDDIFESGSFDIELGDNSNEIVNTGIDTEDKSNDMSSTVKEGCKKEDAGSEEDESDNEIIDSVDESMIGLIIEME